MSKLLSRRLWAVAATFVGMDAELQAMVVRQVSGLPQPIERVSSNLGDCCRWLLPYRISQFSTVEGQQQHRQPCMPPEQ